MACRTGNDWQEERPGIFFVKIKLFIIFNNLLFIN